MITNQAAITDNINVVQRTTDALAFAVAAAIESRCVTILDATGRNTAAASATWDNATVASRRVSDDLAVAKQSISNSKQQSYKADVAILNPYEMAYLLSNDSIMSSFAPSLAEVMKTGDHGFVLGLKLLESPWNVTDSVKVVNSRQCALWKQVRPLETSIIDDAGISKTMRVYEYGEGICLAPKAIADITNTKT